VAIYRLLENSSFAPDRIKVMVEAYECACRELALSGARTDALTEVVARKILEIAQSEVETDSKYICERSLQELGFPRH
jgi:ferritin-like protein